MDAQSHESAEQPGLVVAIDAMGGDRAPEVVIDGTLAALASEPRLVALLVGPASRLQGLLDARGASAGPRLRLLDAPATIGMAEHPVEALRRKPHSSIAQAVQALAAGQARAVFSAGNTGALAVAANTALGRLPGVRRPGIAVVLQGQRGPVVLIDAGANLQPRPADLAAYAVLASAYARAMLGIEHPAVGLLNIGSEESKGSALLQQAAALVRGIAGIAFAGFVEGHELLAGRVNVVVADAFTGNAVLKVSEGLALAVLEGVAEVLRAEFAAAGPEQHRRLEAALARLWRRYDYAEYGGAPLLGVAGIVVIGHGRSSARAVASGLRVALRAAELELDRRLVAALAQDLQAAGTDGQTDGS
ncbi:MAG: phosphate acyltransferase [Planctomycetota bacterium]|nr:MAG: phosphate acyltransferase [Planctomycetota bacterium]